MGEEAAIPVRLAGTPPFSIMWLDGTTQTGITTMEMTRAVTPMISSAYTLVAVSDAHCAGRVEGLAFVDVTREPRIDLQPQDATIRRGETATLAVEASGSDLRYDWYELVNDRTYLVDSGPSNTFSTPALQATKSYWVSVIGPCGATASRTAVVTVASTRRRAVRP